MLNNDIKKSQVNILRPVVALSPKYNKIYKKIPTDLIDEMLDKEASLILSALKMDLE
jgi:hypothetical protein